MSEVISRARGGSVVISHGSSVVAESSGISTRILLGSGISGVISHSIGSVVLHEDFTPIPVEGGMFLLQGGGRLILQGGGFLQLHG